MKKYDRVNVFRYERNPVTGVFERAPRNEAAFHAWGLDYSESDFGYGNFSVAIVEFDNGKFDSVQVDLIEAVVPLKDRRLN